MENEKPFKVYAVYRVGGNFVKLAKFFRSKTKANRWMIDNPVKDGHYSVLNMRMCKVLGKYYLLNLKAKSYKLEDDK